MMIINNRRQHPTSTVIQSRYPFFLPTKNISSKIRNAPIDVEIETPKGTVIIKKCLLTQVHRNIVDCIFSYYEPYYQDSGEVIFLFSRYELLQHLGHSSRRNTSWLEDKFEEMRLAKVELLENKVGKENGETHQTLKIRGVITGSDITKIESPNKKESYLYGVIFSTSFMAMFDEDINVYSQKITHKIIQLNNGLMQAFVREVISHSNDVNTSLESILKRLNITVDRDNDSDVRNFNKKIEPLLKNRSQLKKSFGIEIRKMVSDQKKWGVFYKQHPDVFFKKPISLKKPISSQKT